MAYYPYLKNWGMFFQKNAGYENRYRAIMAIASFWEQGSVSTITIPEGCVLKGQVFGNYKFDDGEVIVTTDIKKLERLNLSNDTDNLLVATTATGSRYYLHKNDCNQDMVDLLTIGSLESKRWTKIRAKNTGLNLT